MLSVWLIPQGDRSTTHSAFPEGAIADGKFQVPVEQAAPPDVIAVDLHAFGSIMHRSPRWEGYVDLEIIRVEVWLALDFKRVDSRTRQPSL